MPFFQDRAQAAEELIRLLPPEVGRDWLVLALPRGGVPVAAPIARHLGAALDLMIVRKVGTPGNPELALAAVTGPGPVGIVVNEPLRDMLGLADAESARLARPEIDEVARRRKLWAAPGVLLAGRSVLIVDDGMATGTTLRAALAAARTQGARQIGVALPVALGTSLGKLPADLSPVICPHPSAELSAVGAAYDHFPQVSDDEVAAILSSMASATRP